MIIKTDRWWFLETKGLEQNKIEEGSVRLISYLAGQSILFSHKQDFINALEAMLEYSKSFMKVKAELDSDSLEKENTELKEALKKIDFFATQVLSSSGLNDPKHTLMTTSKLIHDIVEKIMYGKKKEPKNKVVHNYQITIKIMEDQSSKIIVEPLPKDPPKEEIKNNELDKKIIRHYQIKNSKFFLCGRGTLDGWGPEDQCAVHVEPVNCKECLKEWIKRKQQEI